MGWLISPDPDEFLKAADAFLRSSGAEGTLLLTAARALRGGQPLFGWWTSSGSARDSVWSPAGVRGAFVHDPPAPVLIVGKAPEVAASLAPVLHSMNRPVWGVDAAVPAADAFAAAWTQRTGMATQLHRHFRVYRMTGALPYVPGPAGRARTATPADRELLAEWLRAFWAESGEFVRTPADVADELIGYGGAVFWEADGRPVALATLTRPVERAVRVSMVYSPPAFRHRGYAAAATVAASRAALARTAEVSEVLMISDRVTPVRRARSFGYELAGERILLSFTPPTSPVPRLSGPMARLRADRGGPPRTTGSMPAIPADLADLADRADRASRANRVDGRPPGARAGKLA